MSKKIKTEIQIFFLLVIAVIVLIFLSIIVGPHLQTSAIAQGPRDSTPYFPPLNKDALDAFGLSRDSIQLSNGTFDLALDITPSNMSANNGDFIQFVVSITNLGPDPASYVFFSNDLPSEISNPSYQFSVTNAVSDGETKPTWLIPGPINVGSANAVVVTVTGIVDVNCESTVANIAQIFPFEASADPNSANNIDTIDITTNSGQTPCITGIYLPYIRRDPTPTPVPIVFFDDFSDDNSGFPEGDDGNCKSKYQDDQYRLEVDRDEACFRFAPEDAEREFGQFEVTAKRIGGDDKYGYGIYSNGKGGDNYYLFRLFPNDDCGWQLIRRRSGDSTTVREGGCDPAINQGGATNTLKIQHTTSGVISVFVNGKLLGSYTDSSPLTGEGTGVYARSDDKDDLTAVFDNFTVFLP